MSQDFQLHITSGRIEKRPIPVYKCKQCYKKEQAVHIHLEDLYKPLSDDPRVYWQVKPEKRKHYERALVEGLKRQWHERGYEPFEDILFKDGKTHFTAAALCRKRGIEKLNSNFLNAVIDPDKIRNLLVKELDKWELTPIT